jgi:hypothetical protein
MNDAKKIYVMRAQVFDQATGERLATLQCESEEFAFENQIDRTILRCGKITAVAIHENPQSK